MRQSPKVLFFFLFKEHRIKKVMLMKRIYALVPCAVVFSMSFVPIMVNAVFAKTNITDTIHTEPDSSENYPADNTVLIDENTLRQEITSEKNNNRFRRLFFRVFVILALRSNNIVDLIIWLNCVFVENSSYVQISCFFSRV